MNEKHFSFYLFEQFWSGLYGWNWGSIDRKHFQADADSLTKRQQMTPQTYIHTQTHIHIQTPYFMRYFAFLFRCYKACGCAVISGHFHFHSCVVFQCVRFTSATPWASLRVQSVSKTHFTWWAGKSNTTVLCVVFFHTYYRSINRFALNENKLNIVFE